MFNETVIMVMIYDMMQRVLVPACTVKLMRFGGKVHALWTLPPHYLVWLMTLNMMCIIYHHIITLKYCTKVKCNVVNSYRIDFISLNVFQRGTWAHIPLKKKIHNNRMMTLKMMYNIHQSLPHRFTSHQKWTVNVFFLYEKLYPQVYSWHSKWCQHSSSPLHFAEHRRIRI